MALTGTSARFIYSNGSDSNTAQGDPTQSLGGLRPDNNSPADSELYRQATLDALSASLIEVEDTQIDTPASDDPQVGDWGAVITGPAAPFYAKVVDVDYVGHTLTWDRPMPALANNPDRIRTFRRENLFPDVTVQQVQDGVVDHRMIYFLKTNGGSEDNFKFWVEPIIGNGADIEIVVAPEDVFTDPSPSASIGVTTAPLADGEDSPFNPFEKVRPDDNFWEFAPSPQLAYSQARALPVKNAYTGGTPDADNGRGTDAVGDENCVAIWLRRTIPANSNPGPCVFALHIYVDDATTQDASANPSNFDIPNIIHWENATPAYSLNVFSDRNIYLGRTARIIGEVKYPDGSPAVGLNAIIELTAGSGTLTADVDALTDSNGRVSAVYSAPSSPGTDPTFRLRLPTTNGS